MKLRTRLSLCAVLLVMAAVAACCALVLRFAWADASDAALEEARADMERFCTAMRAACREEAGESPLVRRSRVLYAFRSTPGSQEYTLLLGTEYLSNNAGFAPEPLLERGHALTPDGAERYRAVRVGGARYLLLRRSLELGAQEYSLCLVRDVSGLSARIAALATRCAAAGAAVFLIAGLLLWRIVSRALRPVEQLRAGASALARGEYGRRIALRGRDELAGLAADFNAMADAIETNVAALRERAERQQAFIGDLAHEMKTPVTSILLNAELLGRPVAPAAAEAALARIADQGRWLERLSQKLTALVLLGQDIKRREGSVAELFEAVRAATEDALRASGMALALCCAMDTLPMDFDLLRAALVNLVENAQRASRDGQMITLAAHDGVIEVIDRGRGIPAGELARVTEPFYTVDRSRSRRFGGSGLGLALVKRIAEAHGAELSLESAVGAGTTARLTFSRAKDDKTITVSKPH